MRVTGRVLLLIMVPLLMIGGCGGHQSTLDAADGVSAEFTVSVLEDDVVGTAGSAGLSHWREGSQTVVEVSLDGADGLKAFFCEVGYDPEQYAPVTAEATSLLDGAGETVSADDVRVLELSDLETAGVVTHGQVLADFTNRDGFTGSGTVVRLRFEDGPATGTCGVRGASLLERATPVMTVNADLDSLSWEHSLAGDYNRNGIVEVADTTPVGRFYSCHTFNQPDPRVALADGNNDGVITVSDLTPIGQNYGAYITYYEVFYTEDPDQRPENQAVAGPSLRNVVIDYYTFFDEASNVLEIQNPMPAPNGWYWVCANYNGERGPMSASVRAGQDVDSDNALPVASFIAETTEGEESLTVGFDASGSSDSDGEITRYEWDWDASDYTWEWEDAGASPVTGHTYESIGYYTATLRVTDDTGARTACQVEVVAGADLTEFPVAEFVVDCPETHTGHEITFDASGSFDPDGEIVRYCWEFDDDGKFDYHSTSPVISYSYKYAGVYTVTLRVEDDMTAKVDTSQQITITENQAPVMAMTASPVSGTCPLTVTLDPAGTYDPEDELYSTVWTLAGTKLFRSRSYGLTVEELLEPVQQTYYLTGQYECTFYARDEHDLQSAEFNQTVTVDGWETDCWTLAELPRRCNSLDLEVIDDRLALAMDGQDDGGQHLYFCMAADGLGHEWLDPVVVDTDLGLWPAFCDLELVNGLPAISYRHHYDDRIYLVTAKDIEGREWNEPVQVDSGIGDMGGGTALAVIAGNPAVAWGKGSSACYRRARDSAGTEWFDTVVLDNGPYVGSPVDMVEIDGLAAICYAEQYRYLHSVRLMDENGIADFQTMQIPGTSDDGGIFLNLQVINGRPAFTYGGVYSRALDANGQLWPEEAQRIAGGSVGDVDLEVVQFEGRPVCLANRDKLYLCASSDLNGYDWFGRQILDPESFEGYYDTGAAVINGRLYAVYRADDLPLDARNGLVCREIY